jgi:hypothetical protein
MTTPQVVIPIGLIGRHERKPVVEYSDLTATVAGTVPACWVPRPAGNPQAQTTWSNEMSCRELMPTVGSKLVKQATLELAEINAPHGFMRHHRMDITATMAGWPSSWKATQYLMGNHALLADLITLLGGDAPQQLTTRESPGHQSITDATS